jgi:hypothetical protein
MAVIILRFSAISAVLMAVILIDEDDAFIRDNSERMFQDWGHDTLSAGDVDEAFYSCVLLSRLMHFLSTGTTHAFVVE